MRTCFALAVCVVLAVALPASAQVLYENGPINGQTDAYTINFGFLVSDSLTISTGNSHVTGFSFGAWLVPGDVLQSVEISFSDFPGGGTIYFDEMVNVTQSGCFLNQYDYDVCTETASFNGPNLDNGTYWVNLQNADTETINDPVYWDENSGIGCHSEGCPSDACENGCLGSMPSEAFTVLGTTSNSGSVPEPSNLLLFGSGVLGVVGILRRRFR